jgi:hypothetical protein
VTGGLATSSPTTLPLESCPDCDYALAGLPAEGVCPECGRAYDQETVVIFGLGAGVHASLAHTPRRHAVAQIICAIVCPFAIWFAANRRAWVLVAAAAVAAYFAVEITRRYTSRRGALAQVRVNVAGCVQDDAPDDGPNTGPLRMIAESLVFMLMAAPGLMAEQWMRIVWLFMFAFMVVTRLFLPLPTAARFRKVMKGLPGATALLPRSRGVWTPAPIPWSAVKSASLTPLHKPMPEATHQLSVVCEAPWWRPGERDGVNLLIRCTPEQASELAGRIASWREFARQAGALGVKKA